MAKRKSNAPNSNKEDNKKSADVQKRVQGRHTKKSSSAKDASSTDQSLLVTLPHIGLFHYDPLTGKIRWSYNAGKLLHLKNDAAPPSTIGELADIVYEDDRTRFNETFNEAINNGEDWIHEVRLRIPGRSFLWAEFTASIVKNPGARTYVGTFQDITTRKIAEYELLDWKTRNELVSESAGLLIYDYDVNSGDIVWSGNTKQVVGFASSEMDHVSKWQNLIHPDDRDEAFRSLENSKVDGKPYDVYYRFAVKGRDYCYIHDRGLYVTNENNEAVRMLGIMADVSERVKAVKTIEQSEKSYRELFDCVGEAIYIQNPDGTFIDVNRGACEMYGYTKEEFIGNSPAFLSAPGRNDFDALAKQTSEALQGKPQQFVWWGRRKNAEIFPKEVRLTKGTYFGAEVVIATALDVTEKAAAERSLQESEKRFRRMIEDLNVGVVLLGPSGEVQMVNKTTLRLLATSEDDLLHRPFSESGLHFVTEEGKEVVEELLPWCVAARKKQAVRGTVIAAKRHDGSSMSWLLINAEPTLLENEKLLHVLVTLTDISDRKRIEETLKESELRFRTLQEASFGGIGLHNKGVILDCNQGLCDITGFTYDELVGSNGVNLVAPEYRDFVIERIVTKDETPYDVEGLRKDGSRYFLEIKGKNIPFGEGLIRVTEFRDITDRKLAEAKTLEQNARLLSITEDLKLRNEQLREFTQIVSHNLRAPVGNILSLLNFIDNAETPEEQGEYLALLREAGTTILTTLQELNEVLQIKQDKKIERQSLRFEDVYHHVRNMLNAKISEVKAEITTDFSEAPTIYYPNIYLESIMLNLLSNAIKYTYPGRKPLITLKTSKKDNDSILFTISDNGAGINLNRYGEHMFKLRKTFHKHPESRGIGLFMIKNQIEAMGGDISLESTENVGSTFFITFNQNLQDV